MSKHKNGVLRCVIAGKLFEIETPYPVNTGGFDRWRREIVLAGPMDSFIVMAVSSLEAEDAVSVIWRCADGVELTTRELEVMLTDRYSKWVERNKRRRARRAA